MGKKELQPISSKLVVTSSIVANFMYQFATSNRIYLDYRPHKNEEERYSI